MFQNLPLPAAQEVRDSSSGVIPCIVMKNNGVLYHQVLHAVPKKHSCVLRPCATSILIQERCSTYMNFVLGHSHYPNESLCSTHCSRLTEYPNSSKRTLFMSSKLADLKLTRHVRAVLPVLLSNFCTNKFYLC